MKEGLYKFVQVNQGEVRFTESSLYGPKHKELVKEGDIVIAAGLVSIFKDFWKLADRYSISLRRGCTDSVIPVLTEIIGKPYKDDTY